MLEGKLAQALTCMLICQPVSRSSLSRVALQGPRASQEQPLKHMATARHHPAKKPFFQWEVPKPHHPERSLSSSGRYPSPSSCRGARAEDIEF